MALKLDLSEQRKSRPYMLAVGLTLILALLLVLAVHSVIRSVRAFDIKEGYYRNAQEWASHLQGHTPDIGNLITGQAPTAAQTAAINMVLSFSDVRQFALFDAAGNLVYPSDSTLTGEALTNAAAEAAEVARTNRGTITIRQESPLDNGVVVLATSFVPIRGGAGETIGAVKLDLQEVITFDRGYSQMDLLSLLLPLACAVIFLLPTLLTIKMAERARIKDRALRTISKYDPLTGLLNRGGLTQETDRLFAERRDPSQQIGIIFIDLDNFKEINDTHGHQFGDRFLCNFAEQLIEIVDDSGFVGRMGGDEFVAVLPVMTRETIRRMADRILSAARTPFEADGQVETGSVSIGIHLSALGQNQEKALLAADLALFHAKENGRNQVMEYVPALDQANERGRMIERCLRNGIAYDLLSVHFQPFVDGQTGDITGFEALLRLKDEDGNPISPDEFIPVAERTGMIHEIGMWTLETSMQTAKTWPENIYVSVNLSAVQFQRAGLEDRIIEMIEKVGFVPERLELELTESLLLNDEAGVSAALGTLQAHGIRIAMDDFGTGYSSLGYLWKYNFDKIKIDRSFLQGHDFDHSRYRDIIETIILLGHKLGMQVTVEGVETRVQTDMLVDMSCDQFQGFYFARPMPARQTGEVIAQLAEYENRKREASA